jgi:hypothetical protein
MSHALIKCTLRAFFFLGAIAVSSLACAVDSFTGLTITAPVSSAKIGDTVQLTVKGTRADGTTSDVTLASSGTIYIAPAENIVSITPDGAIKILPALSSKFRSVTEPYVLMIIASNGGAVASFDIPVNPTDNDHDGMDDDWERAHGLNPNDPSDANEDPDHDGLTNLQEFHLGTDPHNPDTDGDGVPDGVEFLRGSNPLDPNETFVLNQNCTANIQNRSVQVSPGGSFDIPNVPVDVGLYRVRFTCKDVDGKIFGAQSALVKLVPFAPTEIRDITFGKVDPIPVAVTVSSTRNTLDTVGQTAQLVVTGTLADGTTKDLSKQTQGTLYVSSNSGIVSVSADGLVTAVSSGRAFITARSEGATGTVQVDVLTPVSTVGDGIPDSWKIAHGFSTTDPGVAGADPDHDGLTNLQEFLLGTDPNNPDTDGDGLSDGDEVNKFHTDPLKADTDGDGIPDGLEIKLGTNPLNPDTDGDGIPDGIELKLGLDPLVPDVTTTVQGRVLDGSNNPVAGASVVVFGLITGVTDKTGFFSIQHVPSQIGLITVITRVALNNVIQEGQSAATRPVDNGVTNVGVIKLGQSNGSISGVVTDLQNRPVTNAQVVITIGAETRTTTTDGNGVYGFSGFSPNNYVVTAFDPASRLRGQTSGFLSPNSATTANIQLSASGTIKGTVFTTTLATPAVGDLVVLRLSGSPVPFAFTTSDRAGQFVFDFIPLGSYVVEASDSAGDRGRTSAAIAKAGSIVQADILYLGRGSVLGTVRDGSQNPVPNASVSLNSKSIFGGDFITTTDANGQYSFSGIFIGSFDVTASSSALRLGGHASGNIVAEGQRVTTDVVLGPSATVTGTVLHFDGVTPVSNAQVSLTGGFVTVADGNGIYTFNFVPLGTYSISATDPNNGDQGTGSVTLGAQDEVQTVNVILNGLGAVTATVIDAASAPVGNALLTLTGQSSFGGTFNGVSQPDGTFTFSQVPAGSFSVTASNPETGAGASITGSVAAGQSVNVTLQLQPVGTITGFVFAVDGVTPVAGISVDLSSPDQTNQTVISGVDGSFTFSAVPSGSYTLRATDGNGTVRAQASVTVATQGSVVTQNLVLVGGGIVSGVVQLCAPSCTSISNVLVTIIDSTGKTLSGLTDINGVYTVAQVAVGSFLAQVTLQTGSNTFSGSAQGVISNDGATASAPILLVPQTRLLPTDLFDANGVPYTVSIDGSLQNGIDSEFRSILSALPQGALRLDVISGGFPIRFSGNATATTTSNPRELDIQQTNIAGLDITRKIFIPKDGYFARYLEVLQNPGASPVSIGLRLSSDLRYVTRLIPGVFFGPVAPSLVATTSGGGTIDVSSDHWVLLDDDNDSDPFLNTFENLAPVAHVFDGPGAAIQATSAQFTTDDRNRQANLIEEFDNITVPAGGQVVLMHFISIQVNRLSALSSSLRLVQLPPEALAGIDPTDLAAVQNFAPPANGISVVAPLESLNGTVSGQVFSGDGTSTIADATVSFQSNNPLFARTRFFNVDLNGNYNVAAQFNDLGGSVPVPVSGFVVQASITGTNLQSPSTLAGFPPGAITTRQNIVFTDLGVLRGTVRQANGGIVTSGTVAIQGQAAAVLLSPVKVQRALAESIQANGNSVFVRVPIRADGTYSIVGLPSAFYTLIASVPNAQAGPPNTGTASLFISAGQDATADITLQPVGSVTGTVFSTANVPVPGLTVALHTAFGDFQTATDSGGNFDFVEVFTGVARLEAFDPQTLGGAAASVTVVAGQNVNQSLTLRQGIGSVVGTIVDELGNPVAGAQVTVTVGAGTIINLTTAPDGTYSFNSVPIGPVFVQASDNRGRTGSATGFLDLAGATLTINVTIAPLCGSCS